MDVTSQACSGRWPTFISTGSHPASLRNVRNKGPQLITPIDASLFDETF